MVKKNDPLYESIVDALNEAQMLEYGRTDNFELDNMLKVAQKLSGISMNKLQKTYEELEHA